MIRERENDSVSTVRKLIEHARYHRLGKGDRLPSERELAERFGVARNAVREAVAILDVLRITVRKPNSGIYLRENLSDSSIDALVMQSDLGLPLSQEEVTDLVEARRILEVQTAILACRRRTDDDIANLDAVLAATQQKLDAGDSIADEDVNFHLALIRAAHNSAFLRIVTPFYLISATRRRTFFHDAAQAQRSHAEHGAIVKAVIAQDEAVTEQLVVRHLQRVEDYWTNTLTDSQP